MPLQFNPFIKSAGGLPYSIRANVLGTSTIRLYPSTVPFPSTAPATTAALPAGHILTFSGLTFSELLNPGSIVFATGVVATANATAAGTIGWAAVSGAAGGNVNCIMITDSVVLNGSNGIIICTSMTPASGAPVTISFNLQVI